MVHVINASRVRDDSNLQKGHDTESTASVYVGNDVKLHQEANTLESERTKIYCPKPRYIYDLTETEASFFLHTLPESSLEMTPVDRNVLKLRLNKQHPGSMKNSTAKSHWKKSPTQDTAGLNWAIRHTLQFRFTASLHAYFTIWDNFTLCTYRWLKFRSWWWGSHHTLHMRFTVTRHRLD